MRDESELSQFSVQILELHARWSLLGPCDVFDLNALSQMFVQFVISACTWPSLAP